MDLLSCQQGFEKLLAGEALALGAAVGESGGGWVLARPTDPDRAPSAAPRDWCFAHAVLESVTELRAASVNALAAALVDHFLATAREERFDAPWPWRTTHAAEKPGLARRTVAVEAAARERLARRMARVVRLATGSPPRLGGARGLFVHALDFDRIVVARQAWFGGQQRMADDPAAPSRSFLKVEESYGLVGCEPAPGETVVDLGAAPGGWSYSAARRGATVVAVDNGPLKGGALDHPRIEHRREDAFRFEPSSGTPFDWLFCDLVEEPHHVLRSIVLPWLARAWCRRFVVNLKFGRADAIALLAEVRQRVGPACAHLLVRHLFHDRDEFTLAGRVDRGP